MSLHRSLKTEPAALNQHRNVLTRAERIVKLKEMGRWNDDGGSPLNLPKVASRQVPAGKKEKKAKDETGEAAPAAAAAAPAAKGKK
jgi:small basic protein (TIGR04137 family)